MLTTHGRLTTHGSTPIRAGCLYLADGAAV